MVALLVAASTAARAGVLKASSGSEVDVKAALNSVQDGDTITLPSGTFTWTSTVTITKGVTIQGQTTTNSVNGTANDQTVIVDNVTRSARRRTDCSS